MRNFHLKLSKTSKFLKTIFTGNIKKLRKSKIGLTVWLYLMYLINIREGNFLFTTCYLILILIHEFVISTAVSLQRDNLKGPSQPNLCLCLCFGDYILFRRSM